MARLKSRAGGVMFLALADGSDAVLDAPQDVQLNDGQAIEVEMIAEARPTSSKLARAKFIAMASGDLRRLSPRLSLKDRLMARARAVFGDASIEEIFDRDAIDEAYEQAANPSGPLSNGGQLWIEATRALIACDVDAAETGNLHPGRNFARACNELAVSDLPRRLRLANLGGMVVLDLIGKRHDSERLRTLLFDAFAGEADQIIVAPVGKFGTLEFVRPWGAAPARDLFHPMRGAIYIMWQAIALSEGDRGRIVTIRTSQAVADILKPLIAGSHDPLAPMLRLEISIVHEAVHA
ncbi:MAG: ribonuclease E/G [Asticcacaulis sp.]